MLIKEMQFSCCLEYSTVTETTVCLYLDLETRIYYKMPAYGRKDLLAVFINN